MGCGHSTPNEVAAVQQPGKVSPIYKSLPKGAGKVRVRNVYDGDTLTLVDETRVRFLGIDTPELKQKQAFAQEAKEYSKKYCHKKEIYLVEGGKDHYGRVLGWIYVPQGAGFFCVNEGLIREGLAFAYIPKKDEKPLNWNKLLALQAEARSTKRGVWNTFRDEMVVKTANGSAYHRPSCEHLINIRNLHKLKISQATDEGLHPCRTCMG